MWDAEECLRISLAVVAGATALAFSSWPASVTAAGDDDGGETQTPIKHVIVIVGENRTFDHVFGTYQPAHGQSVWNLLSQGIVNADGSPGPNFKKAQ
ncbi:MULTISPECIES: alkaline phosphatase family protein [Paraburkholderia]|uniref:alkaline phosphatase family protein n=1 Tax=Paraburkholderia TaxID=1822464 RepID=UPI0034A3D5F4